MLVVEGSRWAYHTPWRSSASIMPSNFLTELEAEVVGVLGAAVRVKVLRRLLSAMRVTMVATSERWMVLVGLKDPAESLPVRMPAL